MTASRANRINGLEHVQVGPTTWHALDAEGNVVAAACHRRESEALRLLVEAVYAVNRMAAMERDKWRCVECGSFRTLQAHHKKHRGMGGASRDDRVSNLATICQVCHSKEHGG